MNIATDLISNNVINVKKGNKGLHNKLGTDWAKKYGGKNWSSFYPTLNQILSGLKEQEKVQLKKQHPDLDPSS